MPVYFNRLEVIPTSPITGVINGAASAFQHRLNLLIFLRQIIPMEFGTFPCSDSSIFAYISLGSCYSPVSLDVPVTQHGCS